MTRSLAILAIRGAGKTYTGSVIAEEVLTAGVQLVVLDPLGAWWGLRSAASGNGPGYSVVIFGGEHGDIPLDARAGAVLADLVVEHRLSCILDLSAFRSKADERRFAADFGEHLFRAKGPEAERTPLLFVVDEADEFMPQRVMGESARMLGAYEQIAKRGRIRALGLVCISQRAAAVHKDVLTQCSTLIVQRTVSKQDRTALVNMEEPARAGS